MRPPPLRVKAWPVREITGYHGLPCPPNAAGQLLPAPVLRLRPNCYQGLYSCGFLYTLGCGRHLSKRYGGGRLAASRALGSGYGGEMGTIRIEFVPVQKFALGLFGFDHVQLVFEDETDILNKQDYWFVMEGVQDGFVTGTLGALGENGRTSLGVANGAFGDALIDKIGTPDTRGSRVVTTGDNALNLWDQMARYASEIEAQKLPYIPASLPFIPSPTINSTSFVASLLYSIGIDIHSVLPFGLGLSPGANTLLGTTASDDITATTTFNTVVTGAGNDTLHGSSSTLVPDKLYGGSGDDTFYWSAGPNIIDGGEPRLAYAADGTDTVDYSGVGTAHIEANRFAVEHKVADYTVTFATGSDQLFSIEQIRWTPDSDVITVGDGVGLLEKPLQINLEDNGAGRGDELDFSSSFTPLLINVANDEYVSIQTLANAGEDAGIWAKSLEWVDGSRGDDLIYTGPTMRGASGGDGDDLLDARLSTAFAPASEHGYDIELYGGAGNDTIVAGGGLTNADGGAGFDRYIMSTMSTADTDIVTITIDDADGQGAIYVPFDFFKEQPGIYDGSKLFQLTGAPFAIDANSPISPFLWSTSPDDQFHGYIDFAGQIYYAMDGSDLVISVYQGIIQRDTTTGPDGSETTIIVLGDNATRTEIHVKNWSDGDLGISFPLTFDGAIANQYPSFYDYPGLKEVMQQQTADSLFSAPLDARPDAHLPLEIASNAPVSFARTFVASSATGTDGDDTIMAGPGGPFALYGYAGNDDITGSLGGDIIDGGTGADIMRGGRGNDTYYVDNVGDVVIENANEGFDRVISSIDYTLGDNVENLALIGSAIRGTGNDLRNTIEGNDANNILIGGAGDDTLAGNLGDDWLEGGTGSDGYVYALGDGRDVIVELASDVDRDVLVLAGALSPSDFYFARDAVATNDLILRFNDGGSITIKDYFLGGGAGIEEIDFTSGLRWSEADLLSRAAAATVSTNTAPIARDDAFIAASSGTFAVPFAALIDNDSDYDGDPLSLLSIAHVIGGTAIADAQGNISVTPSTPNGLVSFDYTVTDHNGGTATANFRLQFTPSIAQNSSPQISSATLEAVVEDTVAHGAIIAQDADGDVLSFSVKQGFGPAKGTIAIASDGTFTYTPFANVNGADHFTLTVTDGKSAPVEQVFVVDIAAVNDAPVIASSHIGSAIEDQPVSGFVQATDVDGDALTYALASGQGPRHGTVAIAPDGTFTYTPQANFNGAESFTIQVSDSNGGTAQAAFSFAVAAVNDAPVAVNDTGFTVAAGTTVRITSAALLANDSDVDGDTLTITNVGSAVKGEVTRDANGDVLFKANTGASGTASFTYQISDGHGGTASAMVSLNVTQPKPNHAPCILAALLPPTLEDHNATGIVLAIDLDGDALTYGIKQEAGPQKGSVSIDAHGVFHYTPIANANGSDHFTVTVSDGYATSERTVGVYIAPVNDDPVARDDGGFSVARGGTLRLAASSLLANDTDVDGDALAIAKVGGATGGTVTKALNGDVVFTAAANYVGPASFQYTLSDGHGGSDTALVSISVTGPHLITGTLGRDTLVATSANDLIRGLTGADTFVFAPGGGHDEISDFEVGISPLAPHDTIDLRAFHFTSYAALLTHVTQSGHDTIITADTSTDIRLDDVQRSQLTAGHFIL